MRARSFTPAPLALSLSKGPLSFLASAKQGKGGLRQAQPERLGWGGLFLLLAACGQAEAPANKVETAKVELPKGDVSVAEAIVRQRLGNPQDISFADAERSASGGVPIICGAFEQAGTRQRYIVVGGRDAFIEPQMGRGEMDRAFTEFCGGGGNA